MPRKTHSPALALSSVPTCFNEAAARCRGKLGGAASGLEVVRRLQ